MKKFSFILLVIIVCCCTSKSKEERIKVAQNLFNTKQYSEAIEILDDVIIEDPKNIDALLDRGAYHLEIGRNKEAISDFTKVVFIDKSNTLAYYNRAIANSMMGNNHLSLSDLNKAIRTKGGDLVWVEDKEGSIYKNPYDVSMNDLRYERAMTLYNIDSLRLSFYDFDFCVKSNFKLDESLYYRGIIYLTYNNKTLGCQDLISAKYQGNKYADTLLMNYCR